MNAKTEQGGSAAQPGYAGWIDRALAEHVRFAPDVGQIALFGQRMLLLHASSFTALRRELEKRERDALRRAQPADPAALAAAEQRIRALSTECETSLLRHLERVAAEMPAADGHRYLELMRARVATFGHGGAPELDLKDPHAEHGH